MGNTFRLLYPIVAIVTIVLANIFSIKLIEIAIDGGWQIETIKLKLENNRELAHFISIVLSLFFITIVATRNYSSFIPQRLGVKMYFDPEKAKLYIDKLPKKLKEDYPIVANIDQHLVQFWKEVSEKVTTRSKGEANFTPNDYSEIYGHGEIKLYVTESEGYQQYCIENASGEMNLTYPNLAEPLDTVFEIVENKDRHISATILSLLRLRGFYIRPTFKQSYKYPGVPLEKFKDVVVLTFISAGTRIRITHSIYLLKEAGSGSYIPIGIGIYHSI